MLGEAQMRRQLVEMKRAQLESVTHEIAGSEREGGKGGERGTEGRGRKEKEEQRGGGGRRKRNRGGGGGEKGEEGERGTEGRGRGREGEGEGSICIFMLITHSKCILTSVTS